MVCKKCGFNSERSHCSFLVKQYVKCCKNRNEEIPRIILDVYKDHQWAYCCENCGEVIDYKDMPVNMFLGWLQSSSEDGDTRETSGKALIRYFELDKLLEPKKDAGDLTSEK